MRTMVMFDGPAESRSGVGSAGFESFQAAVGDRHAQDRADLLPDRDRRLAIGEDVRQLDEERFVPNFRTESGGGEQPVALDHWQGHRRRKLEDSFPIRVAGALLESRDRTRIERGAFGEIGLGPTALVAEPFQMSGELGLTDVTGSLVDDWYRFALNYVGLTDDLIVHSCVPGIISARAVATLMHAAKCKDTAPRTQMCVANDVQADSSA